MAERLPTRVRTTGVWSERDGVGRACTGGHGPAPVPDSLFATKGRFLPSSLPVRLPPHQAQPAHIPAHVPAHLGAQGAHARDRLGTGWGPARDRLGTGWGHGPKRGSAGGGAPAWLRTAACLRTCG